MEDNITVALRGGTYSQREPLVLDERDSGTNGFHVFDKAYPGETLVISGGTKVSGWTRVVGSSMWKTKVDTDLIREPTTSPWQMCTISIEAEIDNQQAEWHREHNFLLTMASQEGTKSSKSIRIPGGL